jgi:cytochrome c oxidase assembly protein subunit 19
MVRTGDPADVVRTLPAIENMPPNNRAPAPKPPEKGSFPLDHGGACKPQMVAFQTCLRENGSNHSKCRQFSQLYLTCRMDHQLMAREDLKDLGFTEEAEKNALNATNRTLGEVKKENKGFVAGTNIKGNPSRQK